MSNARPGTALKRLRKANHWTLADVSKKTGIPPSTLSRIENDQISPTYDLLVKLSKGLSIDLSQLLSMESANLPETSDQRPGRRSVNRKDDGETVEMLNHTLRYLSNDLLKKQITPILCEYRSRSIEEFGPLMRHEGEEFLYVIDGELELHTEYYAPLVLKPGESIYFDSRMGHAYVSRGAKPCHALSICTVPNPAETIPSAAPTANGGMVPAIGSVGAGAATALDARGDRTRRRTRRSA
jgi:transcriptional regulator with XRE-family HTH domain